MSKLNKSLNNIISGGKRSRDRFPGYNEAIKIVVQKDINEILQKVEAYFYLKNEKVHRIKTKTLDDYIQDIESRFVITNGQRNVLIKGRRRSVTKILMSNFKSESLKEIQVLDNNYQYIITFKNASYNKKLKQRNLGVIKQKKNKVPTSVRLETDLKYDAQEYAKKHYMTLTTLIENALRNEIYKSDDEELTL